MSDNAQTAPRIVIVGGVAGGASAAARARRLSEAAHITLIERGPDVSFANCGLPYHIGGEIPQRESLAVQTPASLQAMLNIEVRVQTEVTRIDRSAKTVEARNLATGDLCTLPYDKLILAPGASPLRPPLPGIDDPRIYTLRNLGDMDRIMEALHRSQRVAIVGAGFIGLEVAEQVKCLGKDVTLIELMPQVLPQLDPKMSLLIESELREQGVNVILGDGIERFEPSDSVLTCCLKSGEQINADIVVLSIGVKPDAELARDAGLELGPRGHIVVNPFQQTSDPDIYAAGDVVITTDRIDGSAAAVPLGGPANRQGRLIADHIFQPDKTRPYPGSLGTAIVRVFTVTAGLTGWTEKRLQQAGQAYRTVTVNDNHHAGYFPGAKPLSLKICYEPESGRLLGAQATGFEGVDKRIDVMATAITAGLSIDDLCHLELAYAPPFGAAKDIINLAGFAAVNWRDGLVELVDELPEDPNVQLVDSRPGDVSEKYPMPGATPIPLPKIRENLDKLDRSRPVVTACAFGKSSYFAARILMQHGFQVKSFTGGLKGNIDPRAIAKMPA